MSRGSPGLSIPLTGLLAGVLGAAIPAPAAASPAEAVLARFGSDPSVRTLQRAAAQVAEVDPARVRSLLRRARAAAALPVLKVRLARGLAPLSALDSYAPPPSDAWRFEVEAGWQLDRLVFDRNEVGLSRESQRLAARREALQTRVAQLYFERRRLQVDALADPEGRGDAAVERTLAIDELTAILDGLTGGALTGNAKGNQ